VRRDLPPGAQTVSLLRLVGNQDRPKGVASSFSRQSIAAMTCAVSSASLAPWSTYWQSAAPLLPIRHRHFLWLHPSLHYQHHLLRILIVAAAQKLRPRQRKAVGKPACDYT
jgi:hypothetical protein